MKKKHTLLPLSIFIILLSCSSNQNIERISLPQKRSAVNIRLDGTVLLRNIYTDVYLKKLTPKDWKIISESPAFAKENNAIRVYRIPRKFFFRAIIKNTWKIPVKVADIKIKYKDKTIAPLSIKKLKKQLKSPVYSGFRLEEIFVTRRLIPDPEELADLSYENDSVKYTLDFITPGESIMMFLAFDWIPVEQRNYSVIFTLQAKDSKKIIDFELTRFEYRTRGKYYLKPKKDELDEI